MSTGSDAAEIDRSERDRQFDVYTAAEVVSARRDLRWARDLARSGAYSFHDVRRVKRNYQKARAIAPAVWRWAPTDEDREEYESQKAA